MLYMNVYLYKDANVSIYLRL